MRRALIALAGIIFFSSSPQAETLSELSGRLDAIQELALGQISKCNPVSYNSGLLFDPPTSDAKPNPKPNPFEGTFKDVFESPRDKCIKAAEDQVRTELSKLYESQPKLHHSRVESALREWLDDYLNALWSNRSEDIDKLGRAIRSVKNELVF